MHLLQYQTPRSLNEPKSSDSYARHLAQYQKCFVVTSHSLTNTTSVEAAISRPERACGTSIPSIESSIGLLVAISLTH